jgi:ATP-dependent Clp protease ATP-binding subunit ClpX
MKRSRRTRCRNKILEVAMFGFTDGRVKKCSFCGKTHEQVHKLIAGLGVYICDECVLLCNEILEEEKNKKGKDVKSREQLLKPREVKDILDQYVIGQDRLKSPCQLQFIIIIKECTIMTISRMMWNSRKVIYLLLDLQDAVKLTWHRPFPEYLQVPLAIADATSLTEAGYVGEDVENILLKLIQASNGDLRKAEKGIIYIDEIDKVARKTDNPSITRDVSGEGVQQALLKILEGTIANVPPTGGRKHPHEQFINIDTNNILFICGGAFEGLHDIISQRVKDQSMGFRANITSKKEENVGKILSR